MLVKVALGLLILVLVMPVSLLAQGKIVFIDSYRILLEYKEFQDAQVQLDREAQEWKVEIEEAYNEILELEAQLAKQALILSDTKKAEKEAEIEEKKVAWERLANEIQGPGGRAEKRNAELSEPINQKVQQVLETIALEEGYAMILNAVSLAWGKPELDITDRVLEELDKLE